MPRSRIVRSKSRPNNSWSGVVVSSFTTIAFGTKTLLSTLVLNNQGIDETILRVIGSITVASDQFAAAEDQIGSVGLIVVTDLAIAAGAASIPGPSTNIEDDGWFCHQTFANRNVVAAEPRPLMIPFASKGRRIVESGQSVALMVENSDANNGFVVAVQFRVLSRVTGT